SVSVDFNDTYSLDQAYYKINSTGEWIEIFASCSDKNNNSIFALDTTIWNTLGEGNHTIFFRIIDDLGNTNTTLITVWSHYKDVTPANHYIVTGNNTYYNSAPTFDVNFEDNFELDSLYYKVDEGFWNTITTEHTGSTYVPDIAFNGTLWSQLVQGTHTVTFRSIDDAGNENATNAVAWQFYKDTISPNFTVLSTNDEIFRFAPTIELQ
ncbi:MAG: hypothetical protein GY855_10680, partial [candidate division Zixibacteria bacterium]|nr:hypothetical protein [candidate division Zixibacteria bacterium]